MSDEHIVAVIPAFNEERTIATVVRAVTEFADEVIVVDDGSTEGTAEQSREAGAIVYEHMTNQGYDRSLEEGFAIAASRGATIVFTFDADGQHQAEDIPAVLRPIVSRDADLVVGRRPQKARLTERFFAVYTRTRLGITDPLCGFKAYRTAVYRDVGYFDSYSMIGTQLLIEAKKRGYEVAQVDIGLGGRDDEPRFGRRLEANWKIARAMLSFVLIDIGTRASPR